MFLPIQKVNMELGISCSIRASCFVHALKGVGKWQSYGCFIGYSIFCTCSNLGRTWKNDNDLLCSRSSVWYAYLFIRGVHIYIQVSSSLHSRLLQLRTKEIFKPYVSFGINPNWQRNIFKVFLKPAPAALNLNRFCEKELWRNSSGSKVHENKTHSVTNNPGEQQKDYEHPDGRS